MNFYPEDRLPKPLNKVLNSNGEQYNLSDPRFRSADGLPNTKKIIRSSTDDYFETQNAAEARAQQIGCGGYHTVILDGKVYFRPCESTAYYDLRKEQLDSALNFQYIGSYRILTWDTPFIGVSQFNGWIIDAATSFNNGPALNPDDISIDFRYSVDGETWSLWTNVGTALSGTSNETSALLPIILDPANPFYPEFRFTSTVVNPNGTIAYQNDTPIDPSVVIVEFDIDITYDPFYLESIDARERVIKPAIRCSNEYTNRPVIFNECGVTFNPYAVNRALNLYQDLSKIVNKLFGLEVNYYSVQPQARGKDVILREYTLYDVVDEKCVKVLVNQNQFPDNRINFDPFGLQFEEPFEIQIDRRYFEDIFGRGSQPRKRDIIYFPLTNRIYEINSTYLFRDFMNAPVYFKIELKKYQPKSNTFFTDPAYKEELDGISLTTKELFGAETEAEEKKVTKPQQYAVSTTRMIQDPIRSYVYKDMSIIGYDLNNNWTIVFNNYYDLNSAFNEVPEFTYDQGKYKNVVRYKSRPKLLANEELSFTSWFSLKNFYDNKKLRTMGLPVLNISVQSYTATTITYSSYPSKHNLQVWNSYADNPEGYVAIKGDSAHSGGYPVLSVTDEYVFTIPNYSTTFDPAITQWKMQKAQARNFISGLYLENEEYKGFRLDLIHSGVIEPETSNFIGQGSFWLRLNGETLNSPLQFTPEPSEWYGVVVNISNKYKQLSINGWKLSYNPVDPSDQSSQLLPVHEDVRTLTQNYIFDAPEDLNTDIESPYYGTDQNSYKVFSGPLYLTNVRVFKNMIDINSQSTVLNQNVVRDSQLAHIIDNAKPLLNLPKTLRNR